MKTITLVTIIVILLLTTQMFSQTNDNLKLDIDILLQEKNITHSIPTEQIKYPFSQSTFNYSFSKTTIDKKNLDSVFIRSEELWQEWDGANWVNIWKITYGPFGLKALEQSWDGYWLNEFKYNYFFDLNNNVIEQISEQWNSIQWVNLEKITYTYDSNKMIEEIRYSWDGSNWMNYRKIVYTYDGNNNRTEWLWQIWDGSNWRNSQKYTYTYDTNNRLISGLMQTWDGFNWVNKYLYTYIYDGNNNLDEYLRQEWDGSNWVNEYIRIYTYDEDNNVIERLIKEWDGSDWVNYLNSTYSYDGNNNRTEQLEHIWDGSNWENLFKYTYTYELTEVGQLEGGTESFSLYQNFPNPFNPSTTINFSLPSDSYITLKVFNELGEEVAVLINKELRVGTYEVEWDAGSYPSGVYFYQLQTEGFVETKKMILLK